MKKFISIILTLVMCFTLVPGITASADDGTPSDGAAYEQEPLTEDYLEKYFIDLNDEGDLVLPDPAGSIKAVAETDGNGVLLSAKPASDLAGAKFRICGSGEDGKFDFDGNAVARLTIDGLAARKTKAAVNIFIDDAEEPLTTIQLKAQPKEDDWTRDGKISETIVGKGLKGEHDIYFTITFDGIDETKKTSVLLRSIEFAEGSIPVLDFHIDETLGSIAEMNADDEHQTECYGDFDIMVPSEFRCEFTDGPVASVRGVDLEYIRGRGNSTWMADKKPYKIKLDKGQDLFGMGKNKHWVLLANRYDNSLIRNRMTYWLTRKLGEDTGVFAPECVPVEVVMNGRYYGSYLLCEQIRVDESRIEIDDLEKKENPSATEEPEITGGYLISRDFGSDDNEQGISTFRHEGFWIESPDFSKKHTDEAKTAQKNYIQDYVRKVETAIYGQDFKDPLGHGYAEYLDVDSAVDYWWIQEFSENGDAYVNGSTYLYKPRDTEEEAGKLIWGPLWDFDYVAWGDLEYGIDPQETFDYTSFSWMTRLRSDPSYVEKLKTRWLKLNTLLEEITKKDGIIDRYAEEASIAEQYDNRLWGFYTEGGGEYSGYDGEEEDGGKGVVEEDGGEEGEEQDTPELSYDYEIAQLRDWIEKRRAWVNQEGQLDNLAPKQYKVDYVADGKTLETRYLTEGESFEPFPEAPEKEGYTCVGWTDPDNSVVDDEWTVTEDTVLTAWYMKTSDIPQIKDIFFGEQEMYSYYYAGEEYLNYLDVEYSTIPEFAVGRITWSSSDESVVLVDEKDDLQIVGTGMTEITATLPNGKQKSFTAHIISTDDEMDYIEGFSLDRTKLTLESGAYTQIVPLREPYPCSGGNFKWISTEPEVATVDSIGVVVAQKPGTTYVVAYENNTETFQACKVTVMMNKAQKIQKAKKAKTALKAKALKGHKAKLSWKKVKGVSGYYIFRASKKNGKYKRVKVIKKAGTKTWTQKKLKKGKIYFYKIRPFTKISGKAYAGKMSKAVKVKAK